MNRMKTFTNLLLAALCAVLLIPRSSPAQGRERVAYSYTYEGAAQLEDGGEVSLRETELRTGLPPLWRDDTRMLTLGLRWTQYAFLSNDPAVEDFTAHSIRFPIRAAITSTNDWSWAVILTPAIRSDFDGFSTDDLGFNGLVLATYPWRPAWKVSAGMVYGQNFGKSQFFPALGAVWTPSPAWQVDLMFPRPRVAYVASSNLTLNATVEPGGDEWNINFQGDSRDLGLEEYRAGVGADWKLARNLFLALQGGYVFARNLEVRDGRDREFERDLGDTWFARVGLVYK